MKHATEVAFNALDRAVANIKLSLDDLETPTIPKKAKVPKYLEFHLLGERDLGIAKMLIEGSPTAEEWCIEHRISRERLRQLQIQLKQKLGTTNRIQFTNVLYGKELAPKLMKPIYDLFGCGKYGYSLWARNGKLYAVWHTGAILEGNENVNYIVYIDFETCCIHVEAAMEFRRLWERVA